MALRTRLCCSSHPRAPTALRTTFSRNSARSGGLRLRTSRSTGCPGPTVRCRPASFVEQVTSGHPDPLKFLDPTAYAAGVQPGGPVDGARIAGAPEILSDATPGRPPEVTMSWPRVPLETTEAPSSTSADLRPDPRRDPGSRPSEGGCTVTDIILAFPDRDDRPSSWRSPRARSSSSRRVAAPVDLGGQT